MDEVLVIGGSGFVGSHTADSLTESGFKVTIFDKNISPWMNDKQNFIEGDMMNLLELKEAMKDKKYVFHFGGVADIDEADEDPIAAIEANVMGTTLSVSAASNMDVSRFIFGSTIYVYSPYGSIYRASKQASETIIEAYSKHSNLNYTFLRYGSLYGPRAQNWNGLKNRVSEIIKNKKLIYNGTGDEQREYIYVKDAADMSVECLSDEYINQAITLTGQQTIDSKSLIDMIFEIADIKKNVEFRKKDVKSNQHYVNTPYRYTPKTSKKIVPKNFKDFGQGLLEVIEEVSNNEM